MLRQRRIITKARRVRRPRRTFCTNPLRALRGPFGLREKASSLVDREAVEQTRAAGGHEILLTAAAARMRRVPGRIPAAGAIAVTELRVADYAQLAANGLLASEKVIKENPELVRAFISAFLKGLKDTLANPDEAFTLSEKYIPNFSELDAAVQKEVLTTSIEQWQTERLGYSDPQAWENMQNVLLDMDLLTEKQDLSKAFTNEFVP